MNLIYIFNIDCSIDVWKIIVGVILKCYVVIFLKGGFFIYVLYMLNKIYFVLFEDIGIE